MTRSRDYHKMRCTACHQMVWTSSRRRDYMCMRCKRERGLNANGRLGYGDNYTTLAPIQIVVSFGKCASCHRETQALVNERCDDCPFYGLGDVDEKLSERGRRARGGEFDWLRSRWSNKDE